MGSTFSELFLFSIFREQRRERESGGDGSSSLNFLFIFFYVNSFLCTVFFTIIIIKCKASFSSHSSSYHYSMQGFIFISFHPFGGVFLLVKYK